MNATAFGEVFERVSRGGTFRVDEIEAVLADCARIREAIVSFCERCSLGASAPEVAALLLVNQGAPFLGSPSMAILRRPNNGRPQARKLVEAEEEP